MNWEVSIPLFVVYVVIFIALFLYIRKGGAAKEQYDERQEMIRKNAYKYSAMTMIFVSIIYFIVTDFVQIQLAEDGVGAFLIAMLGIAVFAIYSIFKDSFFGIQGKPGRNRNLRSYILVLAIVIISDGIVAVGVIKNHTLVKNGILTHNVMNLSLAILFLLILLSVSIKYILNKRVSEDD